MARAKAKKKTGAKPKAGARKSVRKRTRVRKAAPKKAGVKPRLAIIACSWHPLESIENAARTVSLTVPTYWSCR